MPQCFDCRKPLKKNDVLVPTKIISFVFNGFNFSFTKSKGLCEACAKRVSLERFERRAGGLVEIVDGRVRVNWPASLEFPKEKQREANWLLVDLGIFSLRRRGNWDILSDASALNISLRPERSFYFTRREDVLEYVYLKHNDFSNNWEICHCDEVIKGFEALELFKNGS